MKLSNKYAVYIARVRFVEARDFKLRPVIVISLPRSTFKITTVIPVFSNEAYEDIDVNLVEWQKAGLIKKSVAKIYRMTSMAQTDLLEEIGRLDEADIRLIKIALNQHLEL